MREADLTNSRIQLMAQAEQFVGRYFSKSWIQKNVLHMDEESVDRMKIEIETERMEEQQEAIARAQEEAAMNQQIMQIQAQYAPQQQVAATPEEQAALEQQALAQQQAQQQQQ